MTSGLFFIFFRPGNNLIRPHFVNVRSAYFFHPIIIRVIETLFLNKTAADKISLLMFYFFNFFHYLLSSLCIWRSFKFRKYFCDGQLRAGKLKFSARTPGQWNIFHSALRTDSDLCSDADTCYEGQWRYIFKNNFWIKKDRRCLMWSEYFFSVRWFLFASRQTF